jgi:hypothetical protein
VVIVELDRAVQRDGLSLRAANARDCGHQGHKKRLQQATSSHGPFPPKLVDANALNPLFLPSG